MDNKPVKTIKRINVQPKPKPSDERSKEAWNDLDSQLMDWE